MEGTVEAVQFTCSGAGNQWTTISGVRYATYWDIRTTDWKVGDRVNFRAFRSSLWTGSPEINHADSIRKIAEITA